MAIQSNIERYDAATGTAAPFENFCKLKIGNYVVDPSDFISIRVDLFEDMMPPARISRIAADISTSSVYIYFSDANNKSVGCVTLSSTSDNDVAGGNIINANNVCVGSTLMRASAISNLIAVGIQDTSTGADDFVLRPECHTQTFKRHSRSLSINGTPVSRCIIATDTGSSSGGTVHAVAHNGTVGFDIISSKTSESVYGITKLSIDGKQYSVIGKDAILKHAKYSNLRVVREDTAITLTGVLDV